MNDDNQQTMTPPTADDSTTQAVAPAAPLTGADVADQAKDIAEQNLNGMMPSAPTEEGEAPAEVVPAPASEANDTVVAPAPADVPMPEAPEPEIPSAPEPSESTEVAPAESTDSTPPADTPPAM